MESSARTEPMPYAAVQAVTARILPMSHLVRTLQRIDGRGYGAYKDLQGAYQLQAWVLCIDHVQGDPFAAPSRLRLQIPLAQAGFSASVVATLLASPGRRVALCDFLTRAFHGAISQPEPPRQGSGGSGQIRIDAPGQEVLPRSSIALSHTHMEVRFTVSLPARGRTVMGRQAITLLCDTLPVMADQSLRYRPPFSSDIDRHLQTVEDQQALRQALASLRLVAFIADGAWLPRRAGNDDRPMPGDRLVPWQSPASLAVDIELPHSGRLRGTGIPQGVTLIVGGGYHGKSTLLKALMRGVYDHLPGDGRERVVTDATAVAIRAEDGRRVANVTLTPFIADLPYGQSTTHFCTDDASGSTSQAANIIEALEVGARVLLIDEDTSATNFMVRDRRMQQLVAKSQEPITPFIDRVRQLYTQRGVSSVLVIGGVGDYLDVADTVIQMDAFQPRDVTTRARAIAAAWPESAQRRPEGSADWAPPPPRPVRRHSLSPQRGRRQVVRARGVHTIQYGAEEIDISQVEQIVNASQSRYIADCLQYAYHQLADDRRTVRHLVEQTDALVRAQGLEVVQPYLSGDRAWARPLDIAAALNRLRTLQIASVPSGQRTGPH